MDTEKQFSLEEKSKLQTERALNDAELIRSGARYISTDTEPRLEITPEQYQELHREMERILAEHILSDENIQRGIIEVTAEKLPEIKPGAGKIGYEFELEKEIRYIIDPQSVDAYEWTTHVEDTYDKSGRARIRIKDSKPRLSLKVPLFSKDTTTAKACLRLEFKPSDEIQERDLMRIRELILEETGTQTSEKWGTKLTMRNGQAVWLNRDRDNNWWIEVDEGVEFLPPEGLKIRGASKSSIKTE